MSTAEPLHTVFVHACVIMLLDASPYRPNKVLSRCTAPLHTCLCLGIQECLVILFSIYTCQKPL